MLPPMLPTHRPWPQTLLLTVLALLIAAATIMLACGPVAQPIPEEGDTFTAAPQVEGGSEEPEEEPTATPTPTNNYPKLDASLQDVVRKFESGDLTECQAAAQDLAHHASSVLVEVELPANIDAVDTWMANQGISPRHKDATWAPPHIYAYVPVSLLGALSQQDGVNLIRMSSGIFTDSRAFNERSSCDSEASGATGASGTSGAGGTSGASGASETAEPQLPLWLKGVHPYPRLGTGSKLGDVVYRYEQGEITAAEAAAEMGVSGGTSVDVDVEIEDPDNAEAIATWLRDNGASLGLVIKDDRGGTNYITGSVPLSILGELSNRPGVLVVYAPVSTWPPGPQGAVLDVPLKSPTPTPTPTPQGFAAHNVAPWHTAGYTGSGIKVGIIDSSFDGFSTLQGSELPANPPASKKWLRCYTANSDLTPSANLADCAENDSRATYHGTAVAQAVIDIAPGAELYISNAAIGVNRVGGRYRLWKDVDWMISQGVDVINYSQGWDLAQGLGDGIPRNTRWFGNTRNSVDPLDTIKTAVDAGVIWVNAAGNENRRIWHGAFSDGNSDGYHDYATSDDANYITFGGAEREVIVELRWDDSWGNADCDVDLYLFEEGISTPVKISVATQGVNTTYPNERIEHTATLSGRYYLKVRKRRCNDSSDLSWFQLYVHEPHTLEHAATGSSISYPADSRESGMLAVGAAGWSNTSAIQPYSSRGPTVDGRIKPDLVGADCAKAGTLYPNEVAPGTETNSPGSGCWFWGTSQAAPHVAGLAALVLSRFPDYAPAEVATYLKENADSRTQEPAPNNTDPNNVWGHGFAKLPASSLAASFTTKPTTIQVGQSLSFTLDTTQTRANVTVNNSGDTGKLYIGNSCPTPATNISGFGRWVSDNTSVTLTGCSKGTVTIRLYEVGGTQKLLNIYRVTVSEAASLTGLTISPGNLVETFTSSGTRYTAQVANNISRITVTPTTTTPGATIRVGTSTVSSGSGRAVNLSVGTNAISIVVSATGYTTRTYTITVTRAAATPVATLSGLTISSGTLAPAFASGTTPYTVQVPNNVSSITVTPTTTTPGATIEIDDRVVSSGSGRAVNLIVGDTIIRIEVAATGYTTRNYTITVTRAAATPVASLSALTISSGTLAPVFASGTTAYTAQVANNISSVTITPTTTTPGATIRVGTSTVSSGSASGAVSLSVGSNAIRIAVSATGYTTRTYTITVTRAAAALRPPTNLRLSTVSGHTDRLELTYTRSPETIHRYEFELHYLNKLTGKDVRYQRKLDSQSPETFRSVGRGYWYKARGRNCRNTSQADTCGVWSDWSSQVELSDPGIAITGLTGSYIAGDTDHFSVTLSDLTLHQPYTVTLASSQGSVIGFNYLCNQLPTAGFNAPDNSHTVRFTLHACQITGNTVTAQSGTVTAKLWKGSASTSGNELETTTANATVTKATGSISPLPTTAFKVGHDQTFTLNTNVPSVYITATLSGDAGRLTLPTDQGCHQAISGRLAANGNTITIRGCVAGAARLTLHRTGSIIKLAEYTVTVNASTTKLSPDPSAAAFTVGHDRTFTVTTDIADDPGLWIGATYTGDSGRLTMPSSTQGCHQASSGLLAVNGNTITLRGCIAGTATLKVYRRNSSVHFATYTVTVNASTTKLSPDPAAAAFTVGHDRTFTVTTDIADDPGLWIGATYTGDSGRLTMPSSTQGCHQASSGLLAANGNTITLRGCIAGTATLKVYRRNSSVHFATYTVTVNASTTKLSPTPATFTAGHDQTFTVTTDIADNPGLWIGATYSGDSGRLTMPSGTQGCHQARSGLQAANGNTITLRGCIAGTATVKVYRRNSSVHFATYTVTVNASNTRLSPTPATFTVGTNQTFAVTTDIPNTPGLWIGFNYPGDTGRLLPANQSCPQNSSGIAAVTAIQGGSIALKPCTAGTVTIKVNRSYSSVTLVTYNVTVNSS